MNTTVGPLQEAVEPVAKQKSEIKRWQQTLVAIESAAQGNVVDAAKVHRWLESWGSEHELEAPVIKNKGLNEPVSC